MPTTDTSLTAGCVESCASISCGATFSPPTLSVSLTRPRNSTRPSSSSTPRSCIVTQPPSRIDLGGLLGRVPVAAERVVAAELDDPALARRELAAGRVDDAQLEARLAARRTCSGAPRAGRRGGSSSRSRPRCRRRSSAGRRAGSRFWNLSSTSGGATLSHTRMRAQVGLVEVRVREHGLRHRLVGGIELRDLLVAQRRHGARRRRRCSRCRTSRRCPAPRSRMPSAVTWKSGSALHMAVVGRSCPRCRP